MESMILMSDWHLTWNQPIGRTDDIVETEFKKLQYVFEYAEKHSTRVLLQAGDISDVRRSWDLLYRLASFLNEWQGGTIVFSVLGQHDQYYRSHQQATVFNVLMGSRLISRLVGRPVRFRGAGPNQRTISVYGASVGEDVPKVEDRDDYNILVIHRMILAKKFWKGQSEYDYAPEFLDQHKLFNLILCGDAHQEFVFASKDGRYICNTGPMVRLEASADMMRHRPCFFEINIKTNELRKNLIEVAPPAEAVFTTRHIEEKKKYDQMFTKFTAHLSDTLSKDASQYLSFEEALVRYAKEKKIRSEVMQLIYDRYSQMETARGEK